MLARLKALAASLRFVVSHPLVKPAPVQGLQRWLRWQIGSRLLPGAVCVPFVDSSLLLVRPGMTGATGNVYVGLAEFEEMAFLLHLLRPNDLFFDVGANIGAYTVLAAAVCGAKVVSFEPVAAAFNALNANVRLNDITDLVDARKVVVAAQPGTVNITTDLDTMNHVATGTPAEGSAVVEAITLDSVQAESPSYIKIDTEGSETAVIDGAANTLQSPSLLGMQLELNGSGKRYGYDDAKLLHRICALGFSIVRYDPLARQVRELTKPHADNVLFIRSERLEEVRRRVQAAPRRRLIGREI